MTDPFGALATQRNGDVGVFNGAQWHASGSLRNLLRFYTLVDGETYPLSAAGINKAIEDSHKRGGGYVLLPSGVIDISATIVQPYSNITILGVGQGADGLASGSNAIFGSVLRWTGGDQPTKYMVDIGPLDAGTDALQAPGFTGIHLNGNAAQIKGLRIRSCRNGNFDFSTVSCSETYGLYMGIGPAVSDYGASQYNNIHAYLFAGGAITNGGGVYVEDLGGAASLNDLWLRIEHKGNLPGGIWRDCDNNRFHALNVVATTGTQYDWIEEGPTYSNQSVYINPNLQTNGYRQQTGAGIHQWFAPDYTNGMPAPSIAAGELYQWPGKDGTDTPTVTPTIGAFTSVNAATVYKIIGRMMHFQGQINIVTNGTAAGSIVLPLPSGYTIEKTCFLLGRELAVVGTPVLGTAIAGNGYMTIADFGGLYVGANGYSIYISGEMDISI